MPKKIIVILGPTASGKTKLAAHLANDINGEVISADSRQVYKGMDIGTGKDLDEFTINGLSIPYHLIDIIEPKDEFNLFNFQSNYYESLKRIWQNDKYPIVCGGSGMYLERAISSFELFKVPENKVLRNKLEDKSLEELKVVLKSHRELHNKTDTKDRNRAIRAIEIADFESKNERAKSLVQDYSVFGIKVEKEDIRQRIKVRLDDRLHNGLIEEVEGLIEKGLSHEKLLFFGLEYAFISKYLSGKLNYEEMHAKLLQGIRRFAKRQMTWYRRMEKNGTKINWIHYKIPLSEKVDIIKEKINE